MNRISSHPSTKNQQSFDNDMQYQYQQQQPQASPLLDYESQVRLKSLTLLSNTKGVASSIGIVDLEFLFPSTGFESTLPNSQTLNFLFSIDTI